MASDLPSMNILGPDGAKVIAELKEFLQERMKHRTMLQKDLISKQEQFRALLAEVERDNVLTKQENSSLLAQLDQERSRVSIRYLLCVLFSVLRV